MTPAPAITISAPGYTLLLMGRLDFVPPKTSHQSKRIIRRGPFSRLADSPKLTTARQTWQVMLAPFRPAVPFDGALRVHLELTWPWRASDSKRVRASRRIPCTVKPDVDNVSKTIIDVMVQLGFMVADQQIAELHAEKWIGDRPGLTFHIGTYEEAP